jgi:lipopolysaccharide export LptBFGC system permease protein LptF
MSKTLFWYLFRDLARIFFMASGTLAAIMSFGGLLRPLTENGLDMRQIGKMLTYLTPAMMAYSLPAAALFATTVTYGRLAADNELTACRAAGMSYTAIGLPALVLGLGVAILSLLLLCFIVPDFSLRVEKVIYANLAEVVVSRIGKNHQIQFDSLSGNTTVFAESARMLPANPAAPADQLVQLDSPTIVEYEALPNSDNLRIPKKFYTTSSATARIHPTGADPSSGPVQITLELTRGAEFPRDFSGESQIGLDSATFGPIERDSPIRENAKFMNLWELMRIAADPTLSSRVLKLIDDLVAHDQSHAYVVQLANEPANARVIHVNDGSGQVFQLSSVGPPPVVAGDELILDSSKAGARDVTLTKVEGGRTLLTARANQVRVRAKADEVNKAIVLTLELADLTLQTTTGGEGGLAGDPALRAGWQCNIEAPMDEVIQQLRQSRTVAFYSADPSLEPGAANNLRREQVVVNNNVRSELHGRASFAVSCLILVLVGSTLGMMFKSGNFLTAFAVSFIPALLCITLVVAGQQTAGHVPATIDSKFLQTNQPLQLGLALIWSGNVLVVALAAGLILKLRRR